VFPRIFSQTIDFCGVTGVTGVTALISFVFFVTPSFFSGVTGVTKAGVTGSFAALAPSPWLRAKDAALRR
jgi:hypothetical protein